MKVVNTMIRSQNRYPKSGIRNREGYWSFPVFHLPGEVHWVHKVNTVHSLGRKGRPDCRIQGYGFVLPFILRQCNVNPKSAGWLSGWFSLCWRCRWGANACSRPTVCNKEENGYLWNTFE